MFLLTPSRSLPPQLASTFAQLASHIRCATHSRATDVRPGVILAPRTMYVRCIHSSPPHCSWRRSRTPDGPRKRSSAADGGRSERITHAGGKNKEKQRGRRSRRKTRRRAAGRRRGGEGAREEDRCTQVRRGAGARARIDRGAAATRNAATRRTAACGRKFRVTRERNGGAASSLPRKSITTISRRECRVPRRERKLLARFFTSSASSS